MKKLSSKSLAIVLVLSTAAFIGATTLVFAVQPSATVAVTGTSGNPCLGTPLSLSGGGIIIPANANQINQYKIQVVWSPTVTENGIAIATSTLTSPFPYTFIAGPHSYGTSTPPATTTVRIYHQAAPGNDGSADSFTAVPTCPPNTAPTLSGVPVATTTPEMVAYTFTATATDVDLPADTLTFSLVGEPAGATIDPSTGVFTWTPTEAQGPSVYPFAVRVSDGSLTTSASTTITVDEVNIAPVAYDASVSTPMNIAKLITLGSLDSDFPLDTLIFSIVSAVTNGTLGSIIGDQVTYTPFTSFVGSDSFTYKVNDGSVDSNTATISITVSNSAPSLSAIGDKTVDEETLLSFSASSTDPDSDPLTYSLGVGAPAGAAIASSTGAFTWTPTEAQGPGAYSVNIQVTDGAAIDSETITITVNEVNVAPTADPKEASTPEDTPVGITLTGSDTDIPSQSLTFATSTNPANGTVAISGATATYTPNLNYFGSDSFSYTAYDGVATSAPATVSITVTPVNDAPVVTLIGSSTVALITGDTFTDPGATCSDVEEGSLPVVVSGTVSTSTPGTYPLTYTCNDSDEESLSDSATRTVTVSDTPPAPTPTPTPTPTGGSGGGVLTPATPPTVTGQVLGASTSCEIYVNKFLRRNYKNNSESVTKLQNFLNEHMNAGLPITGFFGSLTEKAVKDFQLKYAGDVLTPWGINQPTGIAYIRTIHKVNEIMCPDVAGPAPINLVPFSKNPDAPAKAAVTNIQ